MEQISRLDKREISRIPLAMRDFTRDEGDEATMEPARDASVWQALAALLALVLAAAAQFLLEQARLAPSPYPQIAPLLFLMAAVAGVAATRRLL